MNRKGVALYFVLGILLVVVLLANIILNFVTSQARLTTHQLRRTQAYYAAQAGVNYALEQLRLKNPAWDADTAVTGGTFRICGSVYAANNPAANCSGNNLTESSFPSSVNYVEIYVSPENATNSRTINASVNYTSQL